MDRETLILETFELSREVGFQHFLKENFNRPDPVLMKLAPEERKAFLRDWWDGARDRMYEGYLQQVSAYGVNELLSMREAYIDTLDAIGMLQWRDGRREQLRQILNGKEEKPQEHVQTKDFGREM